jgi:hypothetical protein
MIDDQKAWQIAKIVHEANAAYCFTIGDYSQPSWDDAPQWQKSSARNAVEFHWNNLQEGIDPRPSASHENWLEEKKAAGWKYGPVKDADKKEHPCFVPYNELPEEQRLKDYLLSSIVKAFFEASKG